MAGISSSRAYAFFDSVTWIACLNVLWLLFTIAGGVVFGFGPSCAAAHVLIRRRVRGDAVPLFRSFAREYFANFARGNALGIPMILVAGALALNWQYFSAGRDLWSQLASAGVFLTCLFAAAAFCYVFPMFARYELPLLGYFLMSSRFAIRHLAGTAILLFVTAAAGFALISVPGIIPFFGIGAWLYLTGWLCDRFFAANDDSVAAAAVAEGGVTEGSVSKGSVTRGSVSEGSLA